MMTPVSSDSDGGLLPGIVARSDRRLIVFLALALSSCLCCGLVGARWLYLGTIGYLYLVWNLFLAWIPFIVALAVQDLHRRGQGSPRLLLFGFLWLLFFPNAPYILTDFVHLGTSADVPLWFDIIVIASFAWTGVLLGFISLYLVQGVVKARLGRGVSWLFAVAVLGLGGFGIYLGRFERWNSWDLFVRPWALLPDAVAAVLDPLVRFRTLAVTLLLSAFLIFTYFILVSFVDLRAERERAHNI